MKTPRYGNLVRSARSFWIALLTLPSVATTASAQDAPQYTIRDVSVIPWLAVEETLLRMKPVQEELKLTEQQIEKHAAILGSRRDRVQRARRENDDNAKFIAAGDAILKEDDAAIHANLTPEQRSRLSQIQLQAQGPLAFGKPTRGLLANRPLPLYGRLKLSDDQITKIQAIYDEGMSQINKAASVPIALDSRDNPPTNEEIRKLVASDEFQAAKQQARNDARASRAAVMERILAVLTAAQRDAYRAELGAPFDLSTLNRGPGDDAQADARTVGRALGIVGGQRADPTFDPHVAHPAYASAERHPRVLFDEAHENFHTAGGRYKPLADLLTHDGYQVIPNTKLFSLAQLDKGDILIIANAREMPKTTGGSAFTDAECDAVRDWVKQGGSLLLIADHPPFNGFARNLAQRFGVTLGPGIAVDPVHSAKDSPASLVFTRKDHLLGAHPITEGRDGSERLERIQTFTGTSLQGPAGSVSILKLSDTAVNRSPGDGAPVSAAGQAQGLALTFGKGRVVVLGEAAELSAQIVGFEAEKYGMNVPGIDNRQMALNIMHWLSGLLEPPARRGD